MTQAQQPEALRLAEQCDNFANRTAIATCLRAQHHRILELEGSVTHLENVYGAAIRKVVELEQGKCLHQIAEPAQDARTAFEAISRFMKCEWNLDWDPAGFYDDAKTDAAFTWFEQGYMRAQQAAAPLAAPFMWAIQEPGGSAYMDENCVSTSRGIVEAEVDGLNLGLGADDEPYKVVPVYLAATQPAAQGMDADSFAQTMSDWAHDDAEDAARWRHTLAHRLTLSPRHLRTDEEVCADIDAALAAQAKQGGA